MNKIFDYINNSKSPLKSKLLDVIFNSTSDWPIRAIGPIYYQLDAVENELLIELFGIPCDLVCECLSDYRPEERNNQKQPSQWEDEPSLYGDC
jgi:hypothetical protein